MKDSKNGELLPLSEYSAASIQVWNFAITVTEVLGSSTSDSAPRSGSRRTTEHHSGDLLALDLQLHEALGRSKGFPDLIRQILPYMCMLINRKRATCTADDNDEFLLGFVAISSSAAVAEMQRLSQNIWNSKCNALQCDMDARLFGFSSSRGDNVQLAR